jgi:hypothetical protein
MRALLGIAVYGLLMTVNAWIVWSLTDHFPGGQWTFSQTWFVVGSIWSIFALFKAYELVRDELDTPKSSVLD